MKCSFNYKNLVKCIPGRNLLITWLLAVWVHLVLISGVENLNKHELPKAPNDFYAASNNEEGITRRVMILTIDGVSPLRMFAHMEDHSKLKGVMSINGTWGVSYSPSYVTPWQRFMSTFTGSYWSPGPGLLSAVTSAFYIGDEETATKLRSNSQHFHAFTFREDTWLNYSYKSDDRAADLWVEKQATMLLKSKAFPEMLNDKTMFIVRFIGVGIASFVEGENSLRSKEAHLRVLNIVENVINAVEESFKDDRTTFILISDNRISPIICWGPAISGPMVPETNPTAPEWKTPYTKRKDLERRSIAPLISCVLGILPPAESIAALPFDFIKDRPRMKAKCSATTAKQVGRLFMETAKEFETRGYLQFSSFWSPIDRPLVRKMMTKINNIYDDGDYVGVIGASRTLIEKAQNGLHFYSEFKRRLSAYLHLIIIIGWLLCCATWICPRFNIVFLEEDSVENRCFGSPKTIFDFVMLLITISSGVIGMLDFFSFRFSAYCITAPLVWWVGLRDADVWIKLYRSAAHPNSLSFISSIYFVLSAICWLMVNDKLALSLLLVGSLTFSSFFSMPRTKTARLKLWLLTSIPYTVIFHRHGETDQVVGHFLSAVCWIGGVCLVSRMIEAKLGDSPLIVANLLSLVAILSNEASGGGPTPYHAVWIVVCFLPIIGSGNVLMRLSQIYFSLAVPFFLVSTGHEPLSFLALLFHTTSWFVAESYSSNENHELLQAEIMEEEGSTRKFGSDDARRVFFYILYLNLAMSTVGITDKFIAKGLHMPYEPIEMTAGSILFWGIKGFIPVVSIGSSVVLLWKRCKGDELALAIAVMFLSALMTFSYLLMVLAAADDIDRLRLAVSYYFFGQYLSLLTIISLPFAYILTIPSLLNKFITNPSIEQ